jgi:class III poly(R)-hydroxyalkanoic acid synthase PhaE subunit
MTDSNFFWNNPLLESQRKYWDAWADLSRQTLSSGPLGPSRQGAGNPWADALEQWWKAVSPLTTGPVQGFYEKLMDMGRSYFAMAQRFAGKPGQQVGSLEALNDWLNSMTTTFSNMSQGLPLAESGAQARDSLAFWDLPLDTWERTMSSLSPFPGDALEGLHPERISKATQQVRDHMDRFLSIPPVGYAREWQEQLQVLSKLALDYQKAAQDYRMAFAKVGTRSIQRFQDKLQAAALQQGQLTSIRSLFDLWVDACEEVYAEYVITDEYAEIYGETVNALMALKHHSGQLVDEALETMNVPTRREMNTLQERLHQSRRENRKLRTELNRLADRMKKWEQSAGRAQGTPPQKKSSTVQARKTSSPTRKRTATPKTRAAEPQNSGAEKQS